MEVQMMQVRFCLRAGPTVFQLGVLRFDPKTADNGGANDAISVGLLRFDPVLVRLYFSWAY